MIMYACRKCGFSGLDREAYELGDVVCGICGNARKDQKVVLTKNSSDLLLPDIIWAWRGMRDGEYNWDGTLRRACFGFDQGTPLKEIADWFVEKVCDFNEEFDEESNRFLMTERKQHLDEGDPDEYDDCYIEPDDDDLIEGEGDPF